MAGHSKFKNIMYRKSAQDAKRAKVFTKLIRELTVASKTGADPDANPRLRAAIAAAKSANMTKDTLERAIARGSGEGASDNFEEIRYEGYGPGGVAIIVEALTDNKNRTASNIRVLFQKNNGALGSQGSASHNFKQKGVVKIDKQEVNDEKMFELAIDSGANECFSNQDFHEIQCEKDDIYNVKKKLEKSIKNFLSTEIEWLPINSINLSGEDKENAIKFLESLEDNEDIQNVYTNAKFIEN